jgi:hypothetical protein
LPKRLCSRAVFRTHLEINSARHLEISCTLFFQLPLGQEMRMPFACRGQRALYRLLGVAAIGPEHRRVRRGRHDRGRLQNPDAIR